MICFGRISLLCCAASRDVSVSAFRARMADAISAGASAAVEELATSLPTKGHRPFLQWPRRIGLGPYCFF